MLRKLFFGMIIFAGVFFCNYSAQAFTEIQSNITTQTVWNKTGSPYIVLNTIYVTAPLTIEPGTIVKFKNTGVSLALQNTFTAIGTPSEKIIFTSVCDNDYGGNTQNYGYPFCYQGILRGQWGSIGIYNTANIVKIKYVSILYASIGFSYMNYSPSVTYQGLVSIENTEIKHSRSGIYIRDTIPLLRSLVLSDNNIGLEVATSISSRIPKISNSSIINNGRGIQAFLSGIRGSMSVDASNNWWGDVTGPYFYHSDPQKANLQGQGNSVMGDGVIFRPWLETEPNFDDVSCTENCYSNVLFLPGIESSRLYTADKKVWEPSSDADAEKLYLDENGKSIRDDIYTKDVLDNAYIPIKGNIYKSFLADLDKWKNVDGLIADYVAMPYDWRLSLDDTLNSGTKTGDNVSYTHSTDTPYIIEELRRLASSSKSGKVTLIAHSNGGLVAKALVNKLGAEAEQLIDKIVFVAVPQSGTPQAIGAILHGYDQGLPVNWLPFALAPRTARALAQNMPSAYNLLPSDSYFSGEGSGVDTPVITFEDGTLTQPFIDNYGNKVDTSTELKSFLLDNTGKVTADSSDIVSPSMVNSGLLSSSDNVHQTLDDSVIPSSIAVYQIAGFGEDTLGTIKYWTGEECLHEAGKICSSRVPKLEYTPELVVDGDGTVVAPSALAISTSVVNAKRYWVDLASYDTPSTLERKHADILEVSELRSFIKNSILIGISTALPDFVSDSEPPASSEKRLRYYLHSPLALSAHDSQGNIISAEDDAYPDAEYRRFGEVQYISVPAGSDPTIVLDGQSVGSFTLEVQEVTGDDITETTTFSAIPTSPDTTVTMTFADGTIAGASPLVVDYDGDGATDFSLEPKPGERVVFDITPPVTTIAPSGTQGTNDWHTSDVTVTLTAQDETNGSGIEKTEYSFDDGTSWNTYIDPLVLSNEGTTTVQYFSTDKQGNKEEVKTETIKIDKTAPEAKIVFNSTIQKLEITGVDNLGQSVSVVSVESIIQDTESVSEEKHWYSFFSQFNRDDKREKNGREKRTLLTTTLTDLAGHTTVIVFEEKENEKNHLKYILQSLSYDGISVEAKDASMQYEWQKDWRGKYAKLDAQLRIPTMNLESEYFFKKNETWITEKPRELISDENDDIRHRSTRVKLSGMIIPSIMTERGSMKINY